MNCKQGDLAVIVRSFCGNEGRIVRCLKFYGRGAFKDGTVFDDIWIIDGRFARPDLKALRCGGDAAISDSWLRPIRPGDGEDETLTWAGKPEGVPA